MGFARYKDKFIVIFADQNRKMKKLSLSELSRIDTEQFKKMAKTPIVVILDDIRSMNNVGSVFRTADAFALEKIYLCGITACPPHKEITKTALGATESMEWEYRDDIMALTGELKRSGYKIYVVEQTDSSVMLDNFIYEGESKIAIILGNEVFGVKEELLYIADGAIEIPQYGTKHSLNISVAAGIVIWDLFRKIKSGNRF